MVVAQKLKEAEITEQDSLLLTRNLLRIAIFNISYIRGLFPEKYFTDKSVPALEMKIKKLMPMDAESRRLIDWMEKGVYDALQKKYLKTLLFCICEKIEGPTIEEYAFSFSYPNGEEVSMNVNRSGNKKNATFKAASADITPDQMRSSACKMVRTLVQLMRTLDQMPGERAVLMKLHYYDDVTPGDYEPPFFRDCSQTEAPSKWTKNPLKMEVGNVNSKHLVLSLKVKSVLDPCEDENNEPEDEMSTGAGSGQEDESSSDSEVHPSLADQFVVAPIGEKVTNEDAEMASDADTQDAQHDEVQTARVKEWIDNRQCSTVQLADILSNFPEMSTALTEDIIRRLLTEGILIQVGKDSYTINKERAVTDIKQEIEMPEVATAKTDKASNEDHMYMKALYHALPMDYVTITKLQNKLDGEVNQSTVRKLIDKMVHDGYLKNSGNKRLGKCVVHSESTNKKLVEVKNAIEGQPMEAEPNATKPFDFLPNDLRTSELNINASTCGGLHSIGSDTTRTREKSTAYQTESVQTKEKGNTPTSNADLQPIASLESVVRKDCKNKAGNVPEGSISTQEKRSRKTSMVKEPILQYVKRQKSQPKE